MFICRQLEQLRGTVRDDVSNMVPQFTKNDASFRTCICICICICLLSQVDSQQKFSARTQREMGETKKMVKKVEGMTRKVSNDKADPFGDVHRGNHGAMEGEQDDQEGQ